MKTLQNKSVSDIADMLRTRIEGNGFVLDSDSADTDRARLVKTVRDVLHEVKYEISGDKINVNLVLTSDGKKMVDYRWQFASETKFMQVEYVIRSSTPKFIDFPLDEDSKRYLSALLKDRFWALKSENSVNIATEETVSEDLVLGVSNWTAPAEFFISITEDKFFSVIEEIINEPVAEVFRKKLLEDAVIAGKAVRCDPDSDYDFKFSFNDLVEIVTSVIEPVYIKRNEPIALVRGWLDVKNYAI